MPRRAKGATAAAAAAAAAKAGDDSDSAGEEATAQRDAENDSDRSTPEAGLGDDGDLEWTEEVTEQKEDDARMRVLAEYRERQSEFVRSLRTSDDENRYAVFRRAAFRPDAIRNLIFARVLQGQALVDADLLCKVAGGMAKVLVGQLTKVALEVQKQRGDSGALLPVHIRLAYERLLLGGQIPQRRSNPFQL